MTKTKEIETNHSAMIHDAQLDYFAKRLATASSDRTIKIFDVTSQKNQLLDELTHEGPVWRVAWSHSKFGSLLASCSYDKTVKIWKERQSNQFSSIYSYESSSSINSICWAPHQLGLILAAASSDGTVAIIRFDDRKEQWSSSEFLAHTPGVNAVSWSPPFNVKSLMNKKNNNNGNIDNNNGNNNSKQDTTVRIVTGGSDNKIKIWSDNNGKWVESTPIYNKNNDSDDGDDEDDEKQVFEKQASTHHGGWVRDVAWAPGLGLSSQIIASCSEDKTVKIWEEDKGSFYLKQKIQFQQKVWRLSWTLMANILAVAHGNNQVSLWKQIDGKFQEIQKQDDE